MQLFQSERTQSRMTVRAAYCDVDGTLTSTTIVTPLAWFKRNTQSSLGYRLWWASLLLRGPAWLLMDRIDRSASNRAIYSQYKGMSVSEVMALNERCYHECIKPRIFPRAAEWLREQREQGVKIVLVTGGLDFIMQRLAKDLDAECIAPGLLSDGDRFTGELNQPALTAERKAEAVRAHANRHHVDLANSFALGDAMADSAMLKCAGNPIAVNADTRLVGLARKYGWKVERFRS